MSVQQLRAAAGIANAPATQPQEDPKTFPGMLKAYVGEISRALPRHLNADRMSRIALTEFRKNPKLGQCDPKSVFAAIIQASQLGLEPGLMGQAYLIPYGGECQLIPGYQGLLDLVRRAGKVKRIEAHVVHDNDKFVYRTGLTTVLEHEPTLDGDPGEIRLVYAVAEFDEGGHHVEVMTRAQVEANMKRGSNYKTAQKYGKQTPWDTDTEEMYRKTVLRRICKFLPKSAELALAVALDDSVGHQHLTAAEAIEGTWAPVQEETPPTQEEQPKVTEVTKDDYPTERAEIAEIATMHDLIAWMNNASPKVKKALHEALEKKQADLKAAQE